jgi:hypothetical protein
MMRDCETQFLLTVMSDKQFILKQKVFIKNPEIQNKSEIKRMDDKIFTLN